MSDHKKEGNDFLKIGNFLFKGCISFMKSFLLIIGRFFSREIPLQWNWLYKNFVLLANKRVHVKAAIAWPILLGMVFLFLGIFLIFIWGGLRAIFIGTNSTHSH